MSKFLIGLLSALVSTNQPAAISNLVEKTTGVSVEIPNPYDPIEVEYLKLLAEDDAAQAEADQWILEDRRMTNASSPTLTLRIKQRFDSVKKDYENFLQRNP
ncbi:MAG: hypothetical protein ABIR24_12290, partial [Verrucomicrobiota bacterium]